MNYVKLVDNLDEFNRYPWGNVAWNFLHEKITTFIEKSRSRDTGKVRLPGFFLPLQIWAFESFPILSEQKICHKVSDTVIPLMLRWKSTFKVSALKLKPLLILFGRRTTFAFSLSTNQSTSKLENL